MYFQTTISVYILFRTTVLLFVKKPTGMGFSALKNFFSTSSLDIIVFANFFEKNQSVRTPRNRAKFIAAGVWD
jgi:hypothetical protein